MLLIPTFREADGGGSEFEANLVNRSSSRTARAKETPTNQTHTAVKVSWAQGREINNLRPAITVY